ncbi:MAG TPA: CCA tRNA nucleotidyltransferase [Atopostipes sp.]|nr:CCA tRNA nucleotidyltransferase [Atopostipes sp.]
MENKLTIDGEFKRAVPILDKIIEAGFEAYFVGGSVRDRLLNLEVNDVDIATSAHPYEIKQIFNRTVDVGIEHGTVLVLYNDDSYEITTFRTESTYKDFRRPDSVTFVRSLREDLKRRDFTMNAIAVDINGYVFDPYEGIKDLKAGIIRAVGNPHERFQEDALRMMRAVRFAAQLDFEIEKETQNSIKDNAALLQNIAVERIQIEFEKLLISQWRSKGLQAMIQSQLYMYCPDLANKKAALVSLISDNISFKNVESAWAFLLYKIDEYYPGTDFKPVRFLKKWKLSNKMIQDALTLFDGLKFRIKNEEINAWEIFNLGKESALEVEALMKHLGAETKHEEVLSVYNRLSIHKKDELDISGHDLMQRTSEKPGKWMSEAIEASLKAVVYNEINNEKEAIIQWLDKENKIPYQNDDK